jgi:hypothetical protein
MAVTTTRTDRAVLSSTMTERARTVPMGEWIAVPFSAANFTGAGAMVWTVNAGNVQTNRYTLIGKTLIWTVYINASTLSGTADGQIGITIPGGFTSAAGRGANAVAQLYDGTARRGMVYVGGSTWITIQQEPYAVFTLNSGSTYVILSITIEVN